MSGTREAPPVRSEIRKFTNDVVHLARQRGWNVAANPSTHGGFPQVVMVRSIEGDRRVVFARLMDPTGHLKPAQVQWMRDLDAVAELCRPQLHAYAWRPCDWPTIEEILQ